MELEELIDDAIDQVKRMKKQGLERIRKKLPKIYFDIARSSYELIRTLKADAFINSLESLEYALSAEIEFNSLNKQRLNSYFEAIEELCTSSEKDAAAAWNDVAKKYSMFKKYFNVLTDDEKIDNQIALNIFNDLHSKIENMIRN